MAQKDTLYQWCQEQLARDQEWLVDLESGKIKIGEMTAKGQVDQTAAQIHDLKRRIAQSEQIIAAYDKKS